MADAKKTAAEAVVDTAAKVEEKAAEVEETIAKETDTLLETGGVPEIKEVGKDDGELMSKETFVELAKNFAPLGLVAFGGPVAHVALLHHQFVERAQPLISEAIFLELFSLCQALPGPSSTQLVTAVGIVLYGWLGGILAFTLFQLPGFIAMTGFGMLLGSGGEATNSLSYVSLFTHGLVAAAFAQVLLAAVNITTRVTGTSQLKRAICMISTFISTVTPPKQATWVYLLLMICGGVTTYIADTLSAADVRTTTAHKPSPATDVEFHGGISRKTGTILLVTFASVTALLILIVAIFGDALGVKFLVFNAFWRMGALVFGGGQVVLPMILNAVVESKWLSEDVFLSGFALVQVMPGPLFNLAPFVGAAIYGIPGALFAALGLFGPGELLLFGVLPFWDEVRESKLLTACMPGITAAASGLINAAVYVFLIKSLASRAAYAIAVTCGALTVFFGYAAPITILIGGVAGMIMILLDIGGPFCTVPWWTQRLSAETLAAVCNM